MKVLLADYLGYCFGVKRAVEIALQSSQENNRVYTYGPLIHNEHVVKSMESKGIYSVDNLEEIESEKIIIRSHGVGKDTIKILEDKHMEIVDATCPFVKKIQRIVQQKHDSGYHIIIIGNRNHPEVIGIDGWGDNQSQIIATEQEALQFEKKPGKYAVVVQTTTPINTFEQIVSVIKNRIENENLEIYNTICKATKDRQEATIKLSKMVDAVIVVGGKNSSNTKKLREIAEQNVVTYAIETYEDLNPEEMKKYDIVGVAAGASTPDIIIQETVRFIKDLKK